MGHAIVAHFLENTDPVHKISVISRGQALGYTISLPTEDKFLTTRAELNDTMAMTLGGRAAEEIVFGEVTTGASNDLEKVTATAKQMVMRFGMSEKLGPRVFGHDHGQPFLGREFSAEPDYSDDVAREIDDEIRRIVEEAHQVARDILSAHREELDLTSDILMRRETIEREQFIAAARRQVRAGRLRPRGAGAAAERAAGRAGAEAQAAPRAHARCRARASPLRCARTTSPGPSRSEGRTPSRPPSLRLRAFGALERRAKGVSKPPAPPSGVALHVYHPYGGKGEEREGESLIAAVSARR